MDVLLGLIIGLVIIWVVNEHLNERRGRKRRERMTPAERAYHDETVRLLAEKGLKPRYRR